MAASSASAFSSSSDSSPAFGGGGSPEVRSKCESLVGKALGSCARVKFMREALAAVGVKGSDFIQCEQCPEGVAAAGGYIPDRKRVVLCQQWVAEQPGEVENTLVHEMIHAYDDARALMDWRDLTQHACTEIRAAHLSGDCSFVREVDRGNFNPVTWGGTGARCVRRRAELSVSMHPGCRTPAEAKEAVERAWATCYADTAPFEKVP